MTQCGVSCRKVRLTWPESQTLRGAEGLKEGQEKMTDCGDLGRVSEVISQHQQVRIGRGEASVSGSTTSCTTLSRFGSVRVRVLGPKILLKAKDVEKRAQHIR